MTMRKLLLTIVMVLALSGISLADGEGNTIMLKFAGVPSGVCSFIMVGLNSANGNLYTCPAGAWVLSGGGGGGGSGTVGANNIAVNSVPNYPAAAGSTTIAATHMIWNDATNSLTLGIAGNGNAVLSLPGNTSGAATFTAPAVAGTNTNAVVSSNAISVPGNNGIPSIISPTAGTTTGLGFTNTNQVALFSNNVNCLNVNQAFGVEANCPITDFNTGNSRLTFAPGLISTTGTGVPLLHGTNNLLLVSADFTTAANTSLQTITGLTYTLPASTALKVSFHCSFNWFQATGTAAVAFGIQGATTAPNSIDANATSYPSTTTLQTGTLNGLNTTTATAVVSVAPSVITTIWKAEMDGTADVPSNASPTVLNFLVSTATSGDAVTVKRGSYCQLF